MNWTWTPGLVVLLAGAGRQGGGLETAEVRLRSAYQTYMGSDVPEAEIEAMLTEAIDRMRRLPHSPDQKPRIVTQALGGWVLLRGTQQVLREAQDAPLRDSDAVSSEELAGALESPEPDFRTGARLFHELTLARLESSRFWRALTPEEQATAETQGRALCEVARMTLRSRVQFNEDQAADVDDVLARPFSFGGLEVGAPCGALPRPLTDSEFALVQQRVVTRVASGEPLDVRSRPERGDELRILVVSPWLQRPVIDAPIPVPRGIMVGGALYQELQAACYAPELVPWPARLHDLLFYWNAVESQLQKRWRNARHTGGPFDSDAVRAELWGLLPAALQPSPWLGKEGTVDRGPAETGPLAVPPGDGARAGSGVSPTPSAEPRISSPLPRVPPGESHAPGTRARTVRIVAALGAVTAVLVLCAGAARRRRRRVARGG